MSKTKNIVINQLVKEVIHRPKSKDGFVLYVKTADSIDTSIDFVGEKGAEASAIYREQSKLNFNSASNIRKLWIYGDGACIQYYTSPITRGESRAPRFQIHSYIGDNLFKIAESVLTYQQKYSEYMMEKAINNKAVEPDRYVLTGNFMGIFANPWVMSNIEEIYIDWTFFMSEDVSPFFPQYSNYESYVQFMQKVYPCQEVKSHCLSDYLVQCCSGGTKNIRNRFPRLRTIAMISNLSDIMKGEITTQKTSLTNIEENKITWYELNRDILGGSSSFVILDDLSSDLDKLNTNFVVREQNYRFDYEVLKPSFASYLTKVEDYKRMQKYSNNSSNANSDILSNIELSELEQRLVAIEQEFGESTLKNVMLCSINGMQLSVSEIKSIMETISKPNRKRLATMVGLEID